MVSGLERWDFELGDVGAGDEGAVAGAFHHDDAHVGVVAEGVHDGGDGGVHGDAHGVEFFGVVEDHPADAVFGPGEHLVGFEGDVVFHGVTPVFPPSP